jgi:hypothetical protein
MSNPFMWKRHNLRCMWVYCLYVYLLELTNLEQSPNGKMNCIFKLIRVRLRNLHSSNFTGTGNYICRYTAQTMGLNRRLRNFIRVKILFSEIFWAVLGYMQPRTEWVRGLSFRSKTDRTSFWPKLSMCGANLLHPLCVLMSCTVTNLWLPEQQRSWSNCRDVTAVFRMSQTETWQIALLFGLSTFA